MGKLPKITNTNYTTKNIEDYIEYSFSGYNQTLRPKGTVFFSELGTPTVSGTATISTATIGQPIGLGEAFLFDPEKPSVRPLTEQSNKPFPVFVTTAAASGYSWNLPDLAFAEDDTLRITFKANIITPTLTVKLTSTTGSDTITWTNQRIDQNGATANGWQAITLEMGTGTKAGTIDYNKFTKIEVIASVASTISLYELNYASNSFAFIGAIKQGDFKCFTEIEKTFEKDVLNVMCKTSVDDVALGEINAETVITNKEMNLEDEAFLTGSELENLSTPIFTVENGALNGEKGNYNNAISTTTVTMPATKIYNPSEVRLSIDGQIYRLADNYLDVGRGEFAYIQDPSTFTFTFKVGTGDDNGKIPAIELLKTSKNPTLTKTHSLGNYFYMQEKAKAGVGKKLVNQYLKCMVTNIETSVDDYTNQATTIRFFPVARNNIKAYTRKVLVG